MAEQAVLANLGIVDSRVSQLRLERDLILGSEQVLYLLRNMFGTKRVTMFPLSSVSMDSGKAFKISFRLSTLMISSSGSRSAKLSRSYFTVLGNSRRIFIYVPRHDAYKCCKLSFISRLADTVL